jgi:signal transduction histidine kinase
VNLEEVLESVLSLYARQIEAKHITVSKQYRVDGTIQSYPGEIRQVFSTLLVNAMEATPKGGRFVLRASTSSDWRNPAIRGIRITLADTGGGISADNAVRIFEPFFTTKGERGTGLGLWVSHGELCIGLAARFVCAARRVRARAALLSRFLSRIERERWI